MLKTLRYYGCSWLEWAAKESAYTGCLAIVGGITMLGLGLEYLLTNNQNIAYSRGAGPHYQSRQERDIGGAITATLGTFLVGTGGWIVAGKTIRRGRQLP